MSFRFHLPAPNPDMSRLIEEATARIAEVAIRCGLYCAGLVDQDRFIGDICVGYCCPNRRDNWWWDSGFSYPVCNVCLGLLRQGEGRVTLRAMLAVPGHD
jgi:hypothetical protein